MVNRDEEAMRAVEFDLTQGAINILESSEDRHDYGFCELSRLGSSCLRDAIVL